MKSITWMTAAAMIAAFSLSAGELKVNSDFKGSALGKTSPAGWTKNFSTHKGIGTSEVVKGEKGGTFALQVKTQKQVTPFYSGPFNVSLGDTIKISADIKGKGKVQFACYGYGPQYLTTWAAAPVVVKADTANYESSIVVKNVKKGKVSSIRVVYQVCPDSDVTISNVKAEQIVK